MTPLLFFIAGLGAIGGAIGVVVLRDPFFAVLALVAHLLSLSVLFLLLRSEFVAAVQVVVYAGAVMVLYVFVVAYIGGRDEEDRIVQIGERLRGRGPAGANLRIGAAVIGGALLVELLIALLGTSLKAISGYGAPYTPGGHAFGTPAYIGELLLTRFLLVFEGASFLLLIAAVGAILLAGRRGGISEHDPYMQDRLTPLDLLRPRDSGTMREGVGEPPRIARAPPQQPTEPVAAGEAPANGELSATGVAASTGAAAAGTATTGEPPPGHPR
jgi:NADH-quinone oxidoreductase subunit J